MKSDQTSERIRNVVYRTVLVGLLTVPIVSVEAKKSVPTDPGNNIGMDVSLSALEELGKYLFFDKISDPERMACVTCHDPDTGWTGSVSGVNLHQVAITGANPHTVADIKPPMAAYASFSPPFNQCAEGGANLRFNYEFNIKTGELVLGDVDLDETTPPTPIPAYARGAGGPGGGGDPCVIFVDETTGLAILDPGGPLDATGDGYEDDGTTNFVDQDSNLITAFQREGNCSIRLRRGAVSRGGSYQFCGGNFWNGRSQGRLGDTADQYFSKLRGATKHIGAEVFPNPGDPNKKFAGATADQALNPMPNPVEQNIVRQAVCEHVKAQPYGALYAEVWGEEIDCSGASETTPVEPHAADVDSEYPFDIAFKRFSLAMGAYEHSGEVNSFSSKRDNALRQELACICHAPDANVTRSFEGTEVSETALCGTLIQTLVETNYRGKDFSPAIGLDVEDGLTVGHLVAPHYDASVCEAEDSGNWGRFPLVGLTDEENLGHDLFYNIVPGNIVQAPNSCSFCHANDPVTDDGAELFQIYADQAYHNIGTPANPEVPADPNPGLAGHIDPLGSVGDGPDCSVVEDADGNLTAQGADCDGASSVSGFFRTPSVRNADQRKDEDFIKAYTHNGWFKSIESIVHFYNTAAVVLVDRNGNATPGPTAAYYGVTLCPEGIETEKDALANNCWPEAEWPGAALGFLIGNQGWDEEQEAALVAYMKALTDTYRVKPPKPFKAN